jgi:hypothetical protein
MASLLRVDKFPKNGKTSGNPKLPNITAAKKPNPKEGPGDNMPEMRGTKPAKAQYTANTVGQGFKKPSLGIGKGSNETMAKGPSIPAEAKESGSVPTGQHHAAGHRAPTSHAEFHKLGSGNWK